MEKLWGLSYVLVLDKVWQFSCSVNLRNMGYCLLCCQVTSTSLPSEEIIYFVIYWTPNSTRFFRDLQVKKAWRSSKVASLEIRFQVIQFAGACSWESSAICWMERRKSALVPAAVTIPPPASRALVSLLFQYSFLFILKFKTALLFCVHKNLSKSFVCTHVNTSGVNSVI